MRSRRLWGVILLASCDDCRRCVVGGLVKVDTTLIPWARAMALTIMESWVCWGLSG